MSDIEKLLLAIRDDRGRGANQLAGDALALLGAAALAAPAPVKGRSFSFTSILYNKPLYAEPTIHRRPTWRNMVNFMKNTIA